MRSDWRVSGQVQFRVPRSTPPSGMGQWPFTLTEHGFPPICVVMVARRVFVRQRALRCRVNANGPQGSPPWGLGVHGVSGRLAVARCVVVRERALRFRMNVRAAWPPPG